jgi:hypothetical protein
MGAATASSEALQVDCFHDRKTGVRLYMNTLGAELGVDVIMNTPQPFRQLLLVTFYRIFCHVFGETFTTIFTGKDIG